MTFDWDAATVKVTVPVSHTATTETQEIEMPVAVFARLLFANTQQPPTSDDLPLAILPGRTR
jgi:hypothetical protein